MHNVTDTYLYLPTYDDETDKLRPDTQIFCHSNFGKAFGLRPLKYAQHKQLSGGRFNYNNVGKALDWLTRLSGETNFAFGKVRKISLWVLIDGVFPYIIRVFFFSSFFHFFIIRLQIVSFLRIFY